VWPLMLMLVPTKSMPMVGYVIVILHYIFNRLEFVVDEAFDESCFAHCRVTQQHYFDVLLV
jgi:hypothetical protein